MRFWGTNVFWSIHLSPSSSDILFLNCSPIVLTIVCCLRWFNCTMLILCWNLWNIEWYLSIFLSLHQSFICHDMSQDCQIFLSQWSIHLSPSSADLLVLILRSLCLPLTFLSQACFYLNNLLISKTIPKIVCCLEWWNLTMLILCWHLWNIEKSFMCINHQQKWATYVKLNPNHHELKTSSISIIAVTHEPN